MYTTLIYILTASTVHVASHIIVYSRQQPTKCVMVYKHFRVMCRPRWGKSHINDRHHGMHHMWTYFKVTAAHFPSRITGEFIIYYIISLPHRHAMFRNIKKKNLDLLKKTYQRCSFSSNFSGSNAGQEAGTANQSHKSSVAPTKPLTNRVSILAPKGDQMFPSKKRWMSDKPFSTASLFSTTSEKWTQKGNTRLW